MISLRSKPVLSCPWTTAGRSRRHAVVCVAALIGALLATPAGAQTFQQTYGTADEERAEWIVQTTDGGYALAGFRWPGAEDSDIYVIKTDANGAVQWDLLIGTPVFDIANQIMQTSDGGYILAGEWADPGFGIYLVRLDPGGALLWSYAYPGTPWGGGSAGATAIDETDDDGFIVTGRIQGTANADQAGVLLRTDANGLLLWARYYQDARYGTGTFSSFTDVHELPDGSIAVTGYTADGVMGERDALLVKTDPAGNVLWARTYGQVGFHDWASGLEPAANGDFLLTGFTKSIGEGGGAHLMRTDPLGNLLWYKTFQYFSVGNSIEELPGGDIILAGNIGIIVDDDPSLLKTDAAGTFLWCWAYGGATQEFGEAVAPTTDGGYAFAAWTNSFGAGSFDQWLIKTDATGRSGCNEQPFTPVLGTDKPPVVDVVLPPFDLVEFVGVETQVNPAGTIDETLCPAECAPTADGLQCEPTQCPEAGDECLPACVNYNPLTGQITIEDCDCRGLDECHVDLAGGLPGGPQGRDDPCIVLDDGSGTVTLPPQGCDYLSPEEVHMIVEGLPEGTTIELEPIHRDFICLRQPGEPCTLDINPDECENGDRTGDCFESVLELHVAGTGDLDGFMRTLFVPVFCEVHTAPRTPGDAVQDFDTDMFRLEGNLFGDPDFCTFRVTGGTDLGMPSSGHTTLTRQGPPGSAFAVESYFDVSYQIEFEGCPGSILEGMSGITALTIRMQTGFPTPPSCVGGCEDGFECIETVTQNADGTIDICCDCQPVSQECEPTLDGLDCEPVICEDPSLECLPACVLVEQGMITISLCDCRGSDDCHVLWDPGTEPTCVGQCPAGQSCHETIIPTPDGYELCCDCFPDPPECGPTLDESACEPFVCEEADEQCVQRCIRYDPASGLMWVLDCDCRGLDECHVVFDPGNEPYCDGNCPPDEVCVENRVINPDGTVDLCCDCVPRVCDCPGDVNGDGVVNGADIGGFVRCLLGNPLPGDNCDCADIDGNGLDMGDIQLFVDRLLSKVPCDQPPCPPEDLVLDLTTGVDEDGGFIPIGDGDDDWIVTVDPGGGTVPRPAIIVAPDPAWLTIPGSQWISADLTGPNGDYFYEFCFCLDPRFQNAKLDLRLRADDRAEVYLNGTLIGFTPEPSFNTPNPTLVNTVDQSLFLVGENCVTVVVSNTQGIVTGLNLAGTVTATDGKCCCEPQDLGRSVDTGVYDGGGFIPIGDDDDTWIVTVDPGGGTVPRPATVIPTSPAWLTIPGTQWISADMTGPNGFYTYEYCFCLDPRFENAQLVLDLRADDNATVWLNGVQVGATPIQSFDSPMPTHVVVSNQAMFQPFENCIEVIVRNQFGVITGLNLSGWISADDGLCCEDQEEPPVCVPNDNGTGCLPNVCPDPTQECGPTCMNVSFVGGETIVTIVECDCVDLDECHVTIQPGTDPFCVGGCPQGEGCVQTVTPNSDGSFDTCCHCEPVGACCLSLVPCMVTTATECEAAGGVYLGDGTTCGGVEACCAPGGVCLDVDAACCELFYGGSPQGEGTDCTTIECGPPQACTPNPVGNGCTPVECPDPIEHCQPTCVNWNPATGQFIVIACDCGTPNECHFDVDASPPGCIGGCPPGEFCHTTEEDNGDGTFNICCQCVPG